MIKFRKTRDFNRQRSCGQFIFKARRSPTQTLNALDEYLRTLGDEPVRWLAREVRSWGNEFSYNELAAAIEAGNLDALIDWQERYAEIVNGHLAPMWAAAIAEASKKATRGMTVLSDSNDYVRGWINTHGGELITRLSDESRLAVMNVILRGQGLRMAPRDIAKEVRPLIGLNDRQAAANQRYKQEILQRYLERGMSESKAAERAEKAALKYAGKQHRYRAETIVLTENAFAYNRGAHMGVSQSIADGYMGRCAMIWTTAGTNRVCSRCLALKDTVVGYTDESGVLLPPLHPRCRCAIMYDEVGTPRATKPKPKVPTLKDEIDSLRQKLRSDRDATSAELEPIIMAAGKKVVAEFKKLKPYEIPSEEKYDLSLLWQTRTDFIKKYEGLFADGLISNKEYEELAAIAEKMLAEYNAFYDQGSDVLYKLQQGRALQMKNFLSQFRPMGMDKKELKKQFKSLRSNAAKVLAEALSYYPTEWIEKSIQRGKLTAMSSTDRRARYKKTGRAYYDGSESVITVDPKSTRRLGTAVHEVGHRMEEANRGILFSETAYYSRRTKGEVKEKLSDVTGNWSYADYEVTRKDNFLEPYMGKDYGGKAYELVSMGFQLAYTDPKFLLQDEDMAEWIFGLLVLR